MSQGIDERGPFEARLAAFTYALGWSVLLFIGIVALAYLFVMAVKAGAIPWPYWARPANLDVWWLLVGFAEKIGWVLFTAWIFCKLWMKALRA